MTSKHKTIPANPSLPRLKALVADDVETMRQSLHMALTEAGLEVDCCGTGNEALKALRMGHYDVAILDIWMPDTNGLAVLRAIRKEQPILRVFVISGGGPRLPLEAAALMAEVLGAEQVLVKPFDERYLVAAIQGSRT